MTTDDKGKPIDTDAATDKSAKPTESKKSGASTAGEKPAVKPADGKASTKPEAKATAKRASAPKARAKADPSAAKRPKAAAKKGPGESGAESAEVVRAHARYVRVAPRKARLVVDHIRGRSVIEARDILRFTERHAARDIAKVLESAVANAGHNNDLDPEDLVISAIYVDEGPTLKRWRPRARGRASQILKRTSHITVAVTTGGKAAV